MKRLICCAGLMLCVCFFIFSQVSKDLESTDSSGANRFASDRLATDRTATDRATTSTTPTTERSAADRIIADTLLALSSPDYRVTPGDVYTLAYAMGNTPVTVRIIVDSSYRVQIANLGLVNTEGKTYRQFKREAEAIVSNNYPLSGVQLALTQPGYFRVYLTGEVVETTARTAWALVRLSSLLGDSLTDYSSLRDITITSAAGREITYDLFRAQRDGDLSQDPYLRPGDLVRINRVDRVVTVEGAVERPGVYQLLPGEHLQELVERYASNLTPMADPSRMELVRYLDSETDSGDKLYLSKQNIAENYPLRHLDKLMVPSILDLEPVMFVEGAIQGKESLEAAESNAANRLTVRFNQGENYASLVRRNIAWFTAVSDTRNAYVLRDRERISLNINPMLYDSNYRSQYFVERDDVLIIPFRQYFVTVAGAVAVPGRYPYIPDRSWDYYVALAGGFVRERNSWEAVDIKDIDGKTLRKSDLITPETIITAQTNAALYYFNRYAPVVTTILSIITTLISTSLLVNK